MQDKDINISAVMDNMLDKIYEFETNKKNNLIVYVEFHVDRRTSMNENSGDHQEQLEHLQRGPGLLF